MKITFKNVHARAITSTSPPKFYSILNPVYVQDYHNTILEEVIIGGKKENVLGFFFTDKAGKPISKEIFLTGDQTLKFIAGFKSTAPAGSLSIS